MVWIYYVIFGRLFKYFLLLQGVIINGKPYFRSHAPVSILHKTLQVDGLLLQTTQLLYLCFHMRGGSKVHELARCQYA